MQEHGQLVLLLVLVLDGGSQSQPGPDQMQLERKGVGSVASEEHT